MADDTQAQAASGTVETTAETRKSPSEFAKFWLQAISLAGEDEKDWRDDAEDTLKRYATGKPRAFNILFANTQTTIPALYNSEPVPDVRRRFEIAKPTPPQSAPDGQAQQAMLAYQQQLQQLEQAQEDSKQVCTAIERALSVQAEQYNFDGCMQAAVRDRQLPGRGVTRVRIGMGPEGSKWVQCEPVQWDDFRHGPGKTFPDWPWISFRHKMTREELVELSPKWGATVKLDAVVGDAPRKDGESLPDQFKRANVWEVWDKAERKIYWFAESFKDGPLKVDEDPYELRDFLPIPEPLYAVKRTNTSTPVCEFKIWKSLADELDTITARIDGIVRVMKWRGLYDGAFAGIVEKLKNAGDGELMAADDAGRAMANGGIDKAIWMMPVEQAIKVVQGLYEAREQAKQALYEMTGVADIMRGQTEASETLGAQRIKAQWGSLRLQEAQRDVQRYARDLFRLMADMMAYAWEGPEWAAVTGVNLTPPQLALVKNDLQREFAIEIETDSTIRADLSRAQENIAGFVEGIGTYFTSVGPAVQAGIMPAPIAVRLLGSFARQFKLGREAEDALDEWQTWLEEQAKNPQQPQQQSDPNAEANMLKAQADAEDKKGRLALDTEKAKAEAQFKDRELALKEREVELKGAQMQQDATLQREGMAQQAQEGDKTRQHTSQEAQYGRQHESQEGEKGRQHEAQQAVGGQQHDMQMAAQGQGEKYAKTDVNYSPGMGSDRCKNCTHYLGGECALVEGPIDPAYWCVLFKAKESKE